MNTLPNNKDTDRTLDALFRRDAAVVPADFTRATLQRLRLHTESQTTEDDHLDALLCAEPLAPNAFFTQQTIARIHAADSKKPRIWLRFPAWAASIAAAMALGFFVSYETAPLPTPTAHIAQTQKASATDLSVYEFAEMAQLANPLGQAEGFLDENNLDAIYMVSALIF